SGGLSARPRVGSFAARQLPAQPKTARHAPWRSQEPDPSGDELPAAEFVTPNSARETQPGVIDASVRWVLTPGSESRVGRLRLSQFVPCRAYARRLRTLLLCRGAGSERGLG